MGGTIVWERRNGQLFTEAMAYDWDALNQEFYDRTKCWLGAASAVRTDAQQEEIFRKRYRVWAEVNGRYVYDRRWWQGQWWYRISPDGTVAAPGSSNHQINVAAGRRGAVDIYDTGSNAGVLTRGTYRDKVFREISPKHGFSSDEGDAIGEQWHKRYLRDPFRKIPKPPTPKPPTPPIPEEDDMKGPIQVRSEQTGNWYAIYELTRTLIRNAANGTPNHTRAVAYNRAQNPEGKPSPSTWVKVDKTVVQSLLKDQENRLAAFLTAIGKSDAITAMREEIAKLIAEEEAATGEGVVLDEGA